MKFTTKQLYEQFKESGVIAEHRGNDTTLECVAPIETAGPTAVAFLDNPKFLEFAQKNKPGALVTTAEHAGGIPAGTSGAILIAPNVSVAHALIKQKYGDRDFRDSEWGRIHPSALIHDTAQVHGTAMVGPGCVIGKNVVIGQNTTIMSNVVVEYDAKIGTDCVIYPGVYIGYGCILGNRVMIQPSSVIGSEGYGFAQDAKRHSHRIPQTGIVVLEDDVRVGANNCIDRAAYAETRIGRGTKFDNLCHVAHNVQIGEDCLLTAGFIVAGSTKLGNRVIASGQTGILDHLSIGDDIILVHRAGVTDSVTEPGVYAGLPLQPLPRYLKNQAIGRKLIEMRKEISDLKKQLESEKKQHQNPSATERSVL